jgi:hypothetical protein
MWSLTSPRLKRISGPKKFRRWSAEKDFFNTIDPKRTTTVHCGNGFDAGFYTY